ncbi:CAAX amino protease [Marinithermofilum abyssi]|uniref:CAAX amino protease n=1 Tax=Marinithermofilum abyssi TaxID=1571185 RepID=A0A8J2YCR7_9BACL|nr:CPBP family intramembrane glutamic endopeptidase [Marinithermofilum abyssi]GGE11089.1 CAAX amino protease [Marinithermofilum abyssi]
MGGRVQRLNGNMLLLNLYLSQAVILLTAVLLLWWQGRLNEHLFTWREGEDWGIGALAGLAVVLIDWLLARWLPEEWLDDGGLNRLLFQNLPVWHIAVVTALVAVAEELLFRGAVQYWLGVFGSALLFTAIHFRYLRKWVMVTVLFVVSLGLGWLTEWTHSLTAAMVAHFLLDFVLGVCIRLGKMPGAKITEE